MNIDKFIDSIDQGIEDMKCCGNCKHVLSTFDIRCNEGKNNVSARDYCKEWEFDGIKQIERAIG